jgi:heme/copper-type cytochrome/quinol oxidase subunit 2
MVDKNIVRSAVAVIVIFGHLGVFVVALALGTFSILRGFDALQTLLMASPILAVVALAAFTFIIDSQNEKDDTSRVSTLYAILCIVFPIILIGLILTLFYLFYLQLDGFGPEQLKVTLGGIETFFGVFLGAISKALFGTSPQK